jgi:N-formylglutamate deformylase
VVEPAVRVHQGNCALLLDSPHSGVSYPEDFGHALPLMRLREAEDTHVEKLFLPWTGFGATLVEARFPRSYIDPNRAQDDIDTQLLEQPWPDRFSPTRKAALGKGLVWRCLDDGTPIYQRRLSVPEIQQRVRLYWQPYWDALRHQAQRLTAAHGKLYHVNCHSMPSQAAVFATDAGRSGQVHPDFVVGDRDGTTCDTQFSGFVAGFLRARGYTVSYNDPYKGVEIVRYIGQPARQWHSVQLEVNRRLYMNEQTRDLHEGFADLQRVLAELGRALIQTFALEHQAAEKMREQRA